MTRNLNDFLSTQNNKKYSTQKGTKIHTVLKTVILDAVSGNSGDSEIIRQIEQYPDLKPFFVASARTEVPVAGIINGVFLSRRIDRMVIDNNTKTITFLDYKTDTDKQTFIEKYKKQLSEYAQLLHSAFPNYKITGYILWLHDWELEKIV